MWRQSRARIAGRCWMAKCMTRWECKRLIISQSSLHPTCGMREQRDEGHLLDGSEVGDTTGHYQHVYSPCLFSNDGIQSKGWQDSLDETDCDGALLGRTAKRVAHVCEIEQHAALDTAPAC